jgi:hypothetical protein
LILHNLKFFSYKTIQINIIKALDSEIKLNQRNSLSLSLSLSRISLRVEAAFDLSARCDAFECIWQNFDGGSVIPHSHPSPPSPTSHFT